MPEFIPEFTPDGLDEFTQGYIDAAEWLLDDSTDDDEGRASDRDHAEGWSDEAIAQATKVCREFQETNARDLELYEEETGRGMDSAGTNFWLTRNHHGAGFWDRGDHPCFQRLTDAAHAYGECDTYVGDNGLIYFM